MSNRDEVGYTPGPWDAETDVEGYAAAIRYHWDGGSKTIAYVEGPGLGRRDEERKFLGLKNAQLISAAPILLDTCRMALAVLDDEEIIRVETKEEQDRRLEAIFYLECIIDYATIHMPLEGDGDDRD